MWVVCAFLTWINIFVFVLLISAHGHGLLGVTGDLTAIDVASIALLAATLAVIGVGVAVALVTFIGYSDIKDKAIAASVQAALKVVKDVTPPVAARTALEMQRTEISDEEADEIAQAENGPG